MLNRSAAIFDKRTMANDDQDLDQIVDDVQDENEDNFPKRWSSFKGEEARRM